MILAVIPARGGSKRLPGKNLLPLGGRPMLAYSILVARASDLIDHVIVSSDSPAILRQAERWGATALERPLELSGDTATTASCVAHAAASVGDALSWVVTLQPNVPLRRVEWLDSVIRETMLRKADSALSVDTAVYKTGHLGHGGWFVPDYPFGARKQDLALNYRENGVFYMTEAPLLRRGLLLGARAFAVTCPPEASLCNIDYEFDYRVAQALFREFGYAEEFQRYEAGLSVPIAA